MTCWGGGDDNRLGTSNGRLMLLGSRCSGLSSADAGQAARASKYKRSGLRSAILPQLVA